MVDRPACPEASRLTGLLDAADAPRDLLDHLARCRRCQDALDQLAVGDSGWLRSVTTPGDRPAPLRETMDALKRVSLSGDWFGGADLPPDFLAASDHPGAIGAVGPYPVVEVVGRGGMGVVFKALDRALNRVIAVKVLAPQWAANGTARTRFLREARAAAAVAHEHVVSIHAVDETGGLPYLVMEYVPGPSLQERIDRDGPLDPKDAVRVGIQTAEGLAAAHAQGLVHRDVKPANILLENGVGRARLTDFGLARAVDDAGCTQHGTIAGTPEYMAPEQAAGRVVDHRADLYSLGCVLYAACAGRPPFRAATSLGVMHLAATTAPPPLRAITPDVPADLDAVVMKLLAKDPAARFRSAEDVADELRRALVRMLHPDLARADRRWRSARRWAMAAGLVLVAGAVVAGGLARRDPGKPADRPPTDPDGMTEGPPAGPDVPAPISSPLGMALVRKFDGHAGSVRGLAVHPDGRRMASVAGWPGGDGTLRVWDLTTGGEIRRINVGKVWCDALAVTPDGATLVVGSGDGVVRLYDWDADTESARLGGPGVAVNGVAVSPDGRRVATALANGRVKVWDAATGRVRWDVLAHNHQCRGVAYSPDGTTLVSGGLDGGVRVWAASTGTLVTQMRVTPEMVPANRSRAVWSVAFADGGRKLVTAGAVAIVWDLSAGRPVFVMGDAHPSGLTAAVVSPAGRRVATCGYEGTVRLWDLSTGKPLSVARAGVGAVWTVAFTPDGKNILSGGGGVFVPNALDPPGQWVPGQSFTIRMWAAAGAGAE